MDVDGQQTDTAAASARPVMVFGAAGQLGEAMVATCRQHWPTIALTRADVDLDDTAAVRRITSAAAPWAIINCAGYNNVDGAEDAPVVALNANAFAVRTLAGAARDIDAVLVHYSSDFIFDGRSEQPYTESSRPAPQSIYAASKLMGEWFAADVPQHYVLRVESLFGGMSRRKSSLDNIIERVAAGLPVSVFTDRVVSPSYAWDVSAATVSVLRLRPDVGVYHCVNTGNGSWYEVAAEVARQLAIEATLKPITLDEVKLRASRPRYCALSNDKLRAVGISMPTWQDAIARAIQARSAPAARH